MTGWSKGREKGRKRKERDRKRQTDRQTDRQREGRERGRGAGWLDTKGLNYCKKERTHKSTESQITPGMYFKGRKKPVRRNAHINL